MKCIVRILCFMGIVCSSLMAYQEVLAADNCFLPLSNSRGILLPFDYSESCPLYDFSGKLTVLGTGGNDLSSPLCDFSVELKGYRLQQVYEFHFNQNDYIAYEWVAPNRNSGAGWIYNQLKVYKKTTNSVSGCVKICDKKIITLVDHPWQVRVDTNGMLQVQGKVFRSARPNEEALALEWDYLQGDSKNPRMPCAPSAKLKR